MSKAGVVGGEKPEHVGAHRPVNGLWPSLRVKQTPTGGSRAHEWPELIFI